MGETRRLCEPSELRVLNESSLISDNTRSMATATDMLRSGLNLMRRLPPRDVRTNLSGLTGKP